MTIAYLGLGSNLGNRRKNLITALALLAERAGDILAISDFHETEAWGYSSENRFLNAVARLRTELSPFALLQTTRRIEIELGRTKKSDGTYHDRPIDIDLLLYGDAIVQTPDLVIPHPLMHERKFVLEPLCEIAPFATHPLLDKRITDLNDCL